MAKSLLELFIEKTAAKTQVMGSPVGSRAAVGPPSAPSPAARPVVAPAAAAPMAEAAPVGRPTRHARIMQAAPPPWVQNLQEEVAQRRSGTAPTPVRRRAGESAAAKAAPARKPVDESRMTQGEIDLEIAHAQDMARRRAAQGPARGTGSSAAAQAAPPRAPAGARPPAFAPSVAELAAQAGVPRDNRQWGKAPGAGLSPPPPPAAEAGAAPPAGAGAAAAQSAAPPAGSGAVPPANAAAAPPAGAGTAAAQSATQAAEEGGFKIPSALKWGLGGLGAMALYNTMKGDDRDHSRNLVYAPMSGVTQYNPYSPYANY